MSSASIVAHYRQLFYSGLFKVVQERKRVPAQPEPANQYLGSVGQVSEYLFKLGSVNNFGELVDLCGNFKHNLII